MQPKKAQATMMDAASRRRGRLWLLPEEAQATIVVAKEGEGDDGGCSSKEAQRLDGCD